MDELIGKQVDRYQVVERIGVGGMATVYKGYHAALDREVAIKVLPPHLLHDETFVARFQREARSVAGLTHPHILPVYDYGRDGDLIFVVMQLVTGGTLKEQIHGPMDLRAVARIVTGISSALDYAHARQIIHRDVKPSNILLGENDWPFLADFGIAKLAEAQTRLTKTGAGIGTPEYMSPEQAQGLPIDGRSDIYSLGAVLYEMVTGTVPFQGDTPLSVAFKHVYEPARPVRESNPDLPDSVEAVIAKSLAKNPNDRYQTGGELSDALWGTVSQIAFPNEIRPAGMTGPTMVPRIDRGSGELPAGNPRLDPLYREARALIEVGEFVLAAGKLKEIQVVDPNYLDVEELLGQVSGQIAQSQSLETLYRMGNRHFEAGQYALAAEMFTRIVALDPGFRDARSMLAECEIRQNGAATNVAGISMGAASAPSIPAIPAAPPNTESAGGRNRLPLILAALLALLLIGGGAAFASGFGRNQNGDSNNGVSGLTTNQETATPTPTTAPPSATPAPPTATPEPPTATAVVEVPPEPTNTTAPVVVPPTNTPIIRPTTPPAPPTATPVPPTNTPAPPPPTSTPVPVVSTPSFFAPTNTPAPTQAPSQGGDDGGGGTRR